MTTELEIGLYILHPGGLLGYHVITRVPPLLHTPLMSATNGVFSGISLIGSLVSPRQLQPVEHGPRVHRGDLLFDKTWSAAF